MKTVRHSLLLLLTWFGAVHAQPGVQWVARYNGSANGSDGGARMAVDGSGNVYVCGFSNGGAATQDDIVVIKYNSSGVQQWIATYNGSANSSDYAVAIALDRNENIYVAGTVTNTTTRRDYIVLKYNAAGARQWLATYNHTANADDDAWAMSVDTSGNVYVTGSSLRTTFSGSEDIATVKLNSAGVQQWVARENGTANSSDFGGAVYADNAGNVFVAGRLENTGTQSDIATIKYNAAGVRQWISQYNGPANGFDGAMGVRVDSQGNVYVAGISDGGAATRYDVVTIKYNSAGVQQWATRHNGSSNGYDGAYAIALDNNLNVYFVGYQQEGTQQFGLTVKYNNSGVQQWASVYRGPIDSSGANRAVYVDELGDVYTTGENRGSGSDADYATIKYNSAGVQQWVARYNGTGNGADRASSIALDAQKNVYIAGNSPNSANSDIVTIKYASASGVQVLTNDVPKEFSLEQNYPNPFNPTTKIRFTLSSQERDGLRSFVSLKVYDVLGREVATLVNENLNAGNYATTFDARQTNGGQATGLASSIYYYRLQSGSYTETKKMSLVK